MKPIAYFFSALLLFAGACKTQQAATGSSLKKVTITNPGELFSTYDLGGDLEAVAAIDALTGYTAEQKEEVYKYSNEEEWPEGMKSLDSRTTNREQIKKYKAYLLTSFPNDSRGTLYILKIPQADNSSVKGSMALSHDIYIVMTEKGFVMK